MCVTTCKLCLCLCKRSFFNIKIDRAKIGENRGRKAVTVKGGMSLRNGMWHGLRNDIIMWNLICAAE